LSQPATSPVVPSVAMNRKASGTPPKLANTPEAVITTWRRIAALGREDRVGDQQPEDPRHDGGDHGQLDALSKPCR
jgi:hypothetical protein